MHVDRGKGELGGSGVARFPCFFVLEFVLVLLFFFKSCSDRQVRQRCWHGCGDLQWRLRCGVRVPSRIYVCEPSRRHVCVGSVCGCRGDVVHCLRGGSVLDCTSRYEQRNDCVLSTVVVGGYVLEGCSYAPQSVLGFVRKSDSASCAFSRWFLLLAWPSLLPAPTFEFAL